MKENQVHIPEDWHLKQVQEFALKIRSGGTPKSDNPRYYNGDIPFVAIDDLTSANKYLEKTQKQITNEGLNNSAAWLVPVNTIMYSIYATLGVPRINLIEAATNQAILNIIPDETKITREFLYYLLLEKRGSILAHSAHTTQSNLNAKIVKELEFVFPTRTAEQTQIATILSKVDEAIAQTEQLIAKYTRIKTGLMQDLLTKGIDEQGNIRSEATHEFKDSPLGRIPKDWKCEKLGKVGTIARGKFTPRPRNNPMYYNGKYPFIQTGDISNCKTLYLDNFTQTLNEKGITVSKKFPKGTIVMTIAANIGDTAILNREMYLTDSVVGILSSLNEIYLELFLRSIKVQLENTATQSAQKNINIKKLNEVFVKYPTSAKEQNEIVAKYLSIGKIIDNFETHLSKLQSLKTGLMQDLLSGKVRVNHLIKETMKA